MLLLLLIQLLLLLYLLALGSYTEPIRRLNWWSAPRDGGGGDT